MAKQTSMPLRLVFIISGLLFAQLSPESVRGQSTRDTIATYSGSGQVTTEPFRVSGSWRVEWESTAEVFFLNGFEAGNPNSTYPSQIAGPNASPTGDAYVDRGGRYYFKVVSSGGWKLTVVQPGTSEKVGSDTKNPTEATESAVLKATYLPPNPGGSDFFGETLKEVGDLNDDGKADILVGTWGKSAAGLDGAGKAFLVSGASESILRTLTSPNPQEYGFFGSVGARAGDINDDGTADFIIGAFAEEHDEESSAGLAYLISGRTGETLRTLTSPNLEMSGGFGSSVERIGDTNGDGMPDLLIGAHRESPDGIETAGRAYLISSVDGLVLQTLTSPNAEEQGLFGRSVSRVPDTDGDRVPDLLVAAPDESADGVKEAGRVYLVSGADGQVIHALSSPNPQEEGSLGSSIAEIGDVNGDDSPDFLVAAYMEDVGQRREAGRAYIFSGRDGKVLRTLTSPNPETEGRFGNSVVGGEDVNGDDLPDVAVGAKRESPNGISKAGRVYSFSGASGKLLHSLTSPKAEEEGLFGASVAILKNGSENSTSDLVVGAQHESVGGIEGVGRVYRFEVRY